MLVQTRQGDDGDDVWIANALLMWVNRSRHLLYELTAPSTLPPVAADRRGGKGCIATLLYACSKLPTTRGAGE